MTKSQGLIIVLSISQHEEYTLGNLFNDDDGLPCGMYRRRN